MRAHVKSEVLVLRVVKKINNNSKIHCHILQRSKNSTYLFYAASVEGEQVYGEIETFHLAHVQWFRQGVRNKFVV